MGKKLKNMFLESSRIKYKSEDIWKYLESFDILGLTETWIKEKLKEKVSNKFKWECIPAVREKKKGRAKSGIILAINKEFGYTEWKECSKRVAEVKLNYNRKTWRIMIIYSQNTDEITNQIEG